MNINTEEEILEIVELKGKILRLERENKILKERKSEEYIDDHRKNIFDIQREEKYLKEINNLKSHIKEMHEDLLEKQGRWK